MRIATSFLHNTTLRQMQEAQADMDLRTYQITSGNKARRLQDISNDVGRLLSLQDLKSNTDQYVKNIDTTVGRLQATEGALQSLTDVMVEAANLWTLARNENSAEVRAGMASKAQGLVESFYNIFQTKFDGRYVFSGQNGSVSPIVTSPTANPSPVDPPPTAYYGGDPAKTQVITASGQVKDYGVTGDNLGFARMKAGLEALWYGLQNNTTVDIDGAIDHLENAQKDLSDMMGEVGGQMAGMNLIKNRHTDQQIFLQESVDELDKVDVAEAMTKFTQEQAAMQASMLVLTRLQSISMLDYV